MSCGQLADTNQKLLWHEAELDLMSFTLVILQARDIYEEAIQTVITVRDFTQVFDAYAQFEKNLISAKMESMEEAGPSEEG